MTHVGLPLRRREDTRFLTGAARYLDDFDPEGALQLAFVRSPHAHARLGTVEVEAARAASGVSAVVTGADLASRVQGLPAGSIEDGVVADCGHPVLARDKVRYVGEAVAAVVARTRAEAEDAAELVLCDYEPLAPILDVRRDPAAPPFLHEETGDDLVRWTRSRGDVDGAFAAADRVVTASFRIPRLVAAPIEPRGAIAEYDASTDLLTIRCSAQEPHRPLEQLGRVLGRDRGRLRIVVPDVGGAFGSKGAVAPEVAVAAVLAIDLNCPVEWAEDRLENFLAAYQGRGLEAEVELAVGADGRMLALRARLYSDVGAYLYPTTAVSPHTTAMLLTGAYAIPAAEVELVGVATSKVPTGPYRGAGRPEAAYIIERMVDLAARELGIDPVELRRRNLVSRDAFPYETALGWVYDSGDYERCLDTVLSLVNAENWDDERRTAQDEGRLVCAGVAMALERCGGLWESAAVEISPEGLVVVRTGSSPHGQGQETAFAQIAADELGVEPDDVEVRWGDSAQVPPGTGTFASRSIAMGGSAIVQAAANVREQGRPVAAQLLGAAEEEVAWLAGRFAVPEDSTRAVTLREVAAAAGGLEAQARFSSDLLFSSGAYAAVVEIDETIGALRVLRLAAADDAGRIVNPLLAEGQVVGGSVQGLGQCLVEEAVYDESGQLRTASFADYSLLTAVEVPPIASAFVEIPTPLNPLGAKGIGEGGAIGVPAAVGNAVADALATQGVAGLDPPFTEEKLWRALHEEE
ncbi:molybdopterin-dependent oxidoreductase [soil metagenome]